MSLNGVNKEALSRDLGMAAHVLSLELSSTGGEDHKWSGNSKVTSRSEPPEVVKGDK